jgi:myo-inositol-1(or 4)-monophosphatase
MDNQKRRLELEKILRSAHDLLLEGWSPRPGADKARQAALKIENKTSFKDLVTQFDKRVEDFLLAKLGEAFPGENFMGEESLTSEGIGRLEKLDSCWVIDPIDGTTNYARAYPFFCTTAAFMTKNQGQWQVQAGGIYEPLQRENFSAARGFGATLNGEKISVTANADPRQALFCTGFASRRSLELEKSFELFIEITKETLGVRRDGSAALDLAHVACGRTDGYWEWGLAPWDMAAGTLLVEEAGGRATLHGGGNWDPLNGEILSSNSRLHEWLAAKINNAMS